MDNDQTVFHVLFGAAGSLKDYAIDKLSEKYDLKVFSSGDLFRRLVKEDVLSQNYCDMIKNGKLIPDNIAIPIIIGELANECWQGHVLLDGFPRTYQQAVKFDTLCKRLNDISLGACIFFDCGGYYDSAKERATSRLFCPECNLLYNGTSKKPKKEGKSDKCHRNLITRDDDRSEVFDTKLKFFKEETYAAIEYYRTVSKVYVPEMYNLIPYCSKVLERYGVKKQLW